MFNPIAKSRPFRLAYFLSLSILFAISLILTAIQLPTVPDPRLAFLLSFGNFLAFTSLFSRFLTSTSQHVTPRDATLATGVSAFGLIQVIALSVASPNFIVASRDGLLPITMATLAMAYIVLTFACILLVSTQKDAQHSAPTDPEKGPDTEEPTTNQSALHTILGWFKRDYESGNSPARVREDREGDEVDIDGANSTRPPSRFTTPISYISKPIWAPLVREDRRKPTVPVENPTSAPRKLLLRTRTRTETTQELTRSDSTSSTLTSASSHPIADRFMVPIITRTSASDDTPNQRRELEGFQNVPLRDDRNQGPSNDPKIEAFKQTALYRNGPNLPIPEDPNRYTTVSADSVYSTDSPYGTVRRPTDSAVNRLSSAALAYLGFADEKK